MSGIVYDAFTTTNTNTYRLVMCDKSQDSIPDEVWRGTLSQLPEIFTVSALAKDGEFGSYHFEAYGGTERNWQPCRDPRLDQHLPARDL